MYIKFWRFRFYIRVYASFVKRPGKTRHARELARTARLATWIYDHSDTAFKYI